MQSSQELLVKLTEWSQCCISQERKQERFSIPGNNGFATFERDLSHLKGIC